LSTDPLVEGSGFSGDEKLTVWVPSEFFVMVSKVPSVRTTVVEVELELLALPEVEAPSVDEGLTGGVGGALGAGEL
jgi:hypothetical protein